MRFVAAILLIASLVIHLLLGSGHLVSSGYQKLEAETEAGDLSSVAGDLDVSKEELDRMHREAQARTASGAGSRDRLLGIGLLASALLQLVAAILLLAGRGRRAALLLIGLAVAGAAGLLLAAGFSTLSSLTLVLLLLALLTAWLSRRRPLATT